MPQLRNRLHLALLAALGAAPACAAPPQFDPAQWALCANAPLFDWLAPLPPDLPPRESTPADVGADQFDVSGKDVYVLTGAAHLQRADQRLDADRLQYTHSTGQYRADGDVRYQDRSIAIAASKGAGSLTDDQHRLDEVRYQLRSARGNGDAGAIAVHGTQSELTAVRYSTCEPGQHTWQLVAKEIELDQDAGVGTLRSGTLRVGDVPVLWLPYATFPLDERRKSGFLFPSVGSNSNTGFDLRVPYYLNLAPNYDLTLTPRVLGRRGLMLGTEFRYLAGETQAGAIEGNWLPDDDITGRDRGSLRIRHSGSLADAWTTRVDLNHVSDDRYFEDFGDSLTASSTSFLESNAGVYGTGANWFASVAVQAWDITDPFIPDSAEPFRRLPRAVYRYDRPVYDWLEVGIASEAVAFDHEELPGGRRYDLRPYVALPFERAAGYVRPEFAYRHTGYDLDRGYRGLGFGERSPSRGTPITSVDAAMFFERDTTLFGERMLQTLQPRLYYLRVPYEDQGDLPVFDTQELDFSFSQLFRPNRYTGADRQMDANQATLALTTRLFEADSGRERLSASIGRIRYFDPQRVQLPNIAATDYDGSPYVADLDLNLTDRLSIGATQQWDPELDATILSGVRTQLRWNSGALVNLAYRYRREVLEQADVSFLAPLTASWRLVGRWNYSLFDDSTLESMGGVEWEGCCMAFRVLGRHYVRNREGDTNNAIYLEIELKGLGSFGRDPEDVLQRGILGYRR